MLDEIPELFVVFAAAVRRTMVARGETPGFGCRFRRERDPKDHAAFSKMSVFQGFRKASTPGYHRSPLRG